MSLGEDRVRVKFNPSATGLVDQIKQKTAELIDLVYNTPTGEMDVPTERECDRLVRLAADRYEEAAMWAVKAATTGK
jgi:hypothetical protein